MSNQCKCGAGLFPEYNICLSCGYPINRTDPFGFNKAINTKVLDKLPSKQLKKIYKALKNI